MIEHGTSCFTELYCAKLRRKICKELLKERLGEADEESRRLTEQAQRMFMTAQRAVNPAKNHIVRLKSLGADEHGYR